MDKTMFDLTKYEQQEILVEALGEKVTLDEIVNAMSSDEMNNVFDFICRMHDIEVPESNEE